MKKQLKKSILNTLHPEVLSKEQGEILSKLAFLKEYDFHLAGGTALALYLNHRTSMDFDFYSQKEVKNTELLVFFKKCFKSMKIIRDKLNTLEIQVKDTRLSMFYYPYQLIRTTNSLNNVPIASIEDISAMKIIAIVQRGNFRDFIDVYYLIRTFGIESIINWTIEKYQDYPVALMLKGLIYFEDADKTANSNMSRIQLFENIRWEEVKKLIKEEVKIYSKKWMDKE